MQKRTMWHGREQASTEVCEISATAAGIEVRGSVTGTTGKGTEFEIKYSLELSPEWDIQHVVVRDAKNEGNELDLQRENGQWFDVDGLHLEAFDGVEFVDLSITPLTNTMPIKRLQFKGTRPQRIEVLYIDLPTFEVCKAEQLYTKLGKHTYRLEATSGFSADLVVDDDDLVVIYPGLFASSTVE